MKIKQAVISFWYKELNYNPICKVGELENSLGSYFKAPFFINEQEPFINIGLPRIMAKGSEKKMVLNMSLVNANINLFFDDSYDNDMVILMINEMSQLFYDALKQIYDVSIVYASFKVEFNEQIQEEASNHAKLLLKNIPADLEDFSIKKGYRKDGKYYINSTITMTKGFKVNLQLPKNIKPNDGDMVSRSMLSSLSECEVIGNNKSTTLEINDRLSYNSDTNYRVNKDNLRDLLYEFKLLVEKE